MQTAASDGIKIWTYPALEFLTGIDTPFPPSADVQVESNGNRLLAQSGRSLVLIELDSADAPRTLTVDSGLELLGFESESEVLFQSATHFHSARLGKSGELKAPVQLPDSFRPRNLFALFGSRKATARIVHRKEYKSIRAATDPGTSSADCHGALMSDGQRTIVARIRSDGTQEERALFEPRDNGAIADFNVRYLLAFSDGWHGKRLLVMDFRFVRSPRISR